MYDKRLSKYEGVPDKEFPVLTFADCVEGVEVETSGDSVQQSVFP